MIKRNIFNKLQKELIQPEILILLGPRQVGKTTLLRMLESFAKNKGHRTSYFDLEQPQVLADFNRTDNEIIELICQSGKFVFIDEFQYVRNISKIFKAIFDAKKKIKIICSGSSSLQIHQHLQESLAGRKFLYRIYPLEFNEITKKYQHYSLEEYLRFGGMPGLTHTKSRERKQQVLSELLSSYILKDIKALVKEENIRAFNHLLYLLAERQGSAISIHSLSAEIGLSSKAINRYLDILEETYVNYRVYSYSKNLGNELKKSCKAYLYDLGVRNSLIKDFSFLRERQDKGVIYESFVFLKLKASLKPNMEIKFWRTKDGAEVDFILLENRKPTPIEVKSSLKSLEIPLGMKRFLSRYPNVKSGYVVNENLEGETNWQACRISFVKFETFANNFQNQ